MKVIAKQSFYDSENSTKRTKGEQFTVSKKYFDKLPRKLVEEFVEKKIGRPKKEKKKYKTKEEKVNLNDKASKES